VGFFEHGNEPFGSIKAEKFINQCPDGLWGAPRLLFIGQRRLIPRG